MSLGERKFVMLRYLPQMSEICLEPKLIPITAFTNSRSKVNLDRVTKDDS